MKHDYPHCWRCDSPLVYYSRPSYYLEITKLKDKIIEENIRSVKTDPIQFTVFPNNFFHLIGQLPVYFLTKQIMCICCGHFFSPVLSPAVYLRLTCPVSLSVVYPGLLVLLYCLQFICGLLVLSYISSFSCTSSSASALKSAIFTGSTAGSSSRP